MHRCTMGEAQVSRRTPMTASRDSPVVAQWCGVRLPPVAVESRLQSEERVSLCGAKRWHALPPPAAAMESGPTNIVVQQAPLSLCSATCSRWSALPPPAAAIDEGPLSIDDRQEKARWSNCMPTCHRNKNEPLAVEAVAPQTHYVVAGNSSQDAQNGGPGSRPRYWPQDTDLRHASRHSRYSRHSRLAGNLSLPPSPSGAAANGRSSLKAASMSPPPGSRLSLMSDHSKRGSVCDLSEGHRRNSSTNGGTNDNKGSPMFESEVEQGGVTSLIRKFKDAKDTHVINADWRRMTIQPQKSTGQEPCSELLRLDRGTWGLSHEDREYGAQRSAREMDMLVALTRSATSSSTSWLECGGPRRTNYWSNKSSSCKSFRTQMTSSRNMWAFDPSPWRRAFKKRVITECRAAGRQLRVKLTAYKKRQVAETLAWLFVLLTSSAILFLVFAGNWLADKLLLVEDAPIRGDPGYLIDFFGGQCVYLKSVFRPELLKLEAFNRHWGWQTVTFPARGDAVPVRAFYFPSPKSRKSPRVIIGHRGGANYLDTAAQTVCYFLRSMNISVLIPNLRSHGGDATGAGGRIAVKWSLQYRDLLGAWDYAHIDPSGLLGGSLDPRFVGILGFEFGGLAAQFAFSMEPQVPALFLDSVVHDARELLRTRLEAKVTSWMAWLFEDQAWCRWKALLGRDLDKDESAAIALQRRESGSLGIVHALEDKVVPKGQRDMFLKTIDSDPQLKLIIQWYSAILGGDQCTKRSHICLDRYEAYKAVLCAFWSHVFDGPRPPGAVTSARCQPFGPLPSEAIFSATGTGTPS